jgi:hypothetical protein
MPQIAALEKGVFLEGFAQMRPFAARMSGKVRFCHAGKKFDGLPSVKAIAEH